MCDCWYLNHLSSLQLLDVAELAGLADQFAALQVDDALLVRLAENRYHKSSMTDSVSEETKRNTDIGNILIMTGVSETLAHDEVVPFSERYLTV